MAKRQRNLKPRTEENVFPLDRLSGAVEEAIQEVENPDLMEEQRAILARMTSDKRMKKVWALLRRRRRPSRIFVYPAIQHENNSSMSPDERQFAALRELFYSTFCIARDQFRVSRPIEIKQNRDVLKKNAGTLRLVAHDLELAAKTGQFGVVSAADKSLAERNVGSLHMVANWLDHLSSILRKPDDPLMVKRRSGDSVVKGVQILIAGRMKELFGDRMHKTSATLASVALDKKTSVKTTRAAPKKHRAK